MQNARKDPVGNALEKPSVLHLGWKKAEKDGFAAPPDTPTIQWGYLVYLTVLESPEEMRVDS